MVLTLYFMEHQSSELRLGHFIRVLGDVPKMSHIEKYDFLQKVQEIDTVSTCSTIEHVVLAGRERKAEKSLF